MNRFRYWLADLISGGELTRVRRQRDEWVRAFVSEYDNHALTWKRAVSRRDALHQIAANVTPGANATVRRMGRIAEDATK